MYPTCANLQACPYQPLENTPQPAVRRWFKPTPAVPVVVPSAKRYSGASGPSPPAVPAVPAKRTAVPSQRLTVLAHCNSSHFSRAFSPSSALTSPRLLHNFPFPQHSFSQS